ncbi:MAG: hydrogenase subunit MbhD domain-containing protein [Candidatus Loosdrechtia sp.]|uniref:hydrogenase subunit MbhD domain-containing protein n=1 Tax=Candidatus Loosdrechtia sp. TaxID=3101272 RepID=UPI003A617EFD|nr:MAG: DUF4040 domain-containing protein [Candidatus Jettenia sp. AMX2]
MLYFEIILLILTLITTYVALSVKDLFTAIILLVLASQFTIVLFFVINSPEIALLEAVSGILFTVFYLMAIRQIGRWAKQ